MPTRALARTAGSTILFSLILSGLAAAQQPESAPPKRDRAPKPVLRGPSVEDPEVPGVREGFAPGREPGRNFGPERMPMPVFLDAIKILHGDEAPVEIRATAEQESHIRSLIDDFNAQRKRWTADNRAELQSLRRAQQARRGGADAMEGSAEEMEASRRAAADRARELEAGAPKVEDLYKKVWEELSEPQRRAVDARLETWRAERAKEREEQYVKRRMAQRPPAAAPPDAAAPARPAPAPAPDARPRRDRADLAARRERLMRLFEQLPPEEQERILDRIEERIKEAGPGRDRPSRNADRNVDKKSPPGLDGVKVPAPEDGSGANTPSTSPGMKKR